MWVSGGWHPKQQPLPLGHSRRTERAVLRTSSCEARVEGESPGRTISCPLKSLEKLPASVSHHKSVPGSHSHQGWRKQGTLTDQRPRPYSTQEAKTTPGLGHCVSIVLNLCLPNILHVFASKTLWCTRLKPPPPALHSTWAPARVLAAPL